MAILPFSKNALLRTAVLENDAEKARKALKSGANPQARAADYGDLFDAALRWERHNVILAYAEAVPHLLDKKDMIYKIAEHAIQNSKTATIEALLARGLNIDQKLDNNCNLLDIATTNDRWQIATWLLKKEAKFEAISDSNKLAFLRYITFAQDTESMQLLLDQGVPATIRMASNQSLLGRSLEDHKFDIALFLFKKGANITHENGVLQSRLIQRAIETNDHGLLGELLEKGVKINLAENDLKETPLHFAARKEKFYAVKFLLDRGADAAIRDISGLLPADVTINPAIRELFKGDLEEKPAAAPANGDTGWVLLASDCVAQIRAHEKVAQKVTDVFNFSSRERTTTIQNLATKAEHSLMKSFDEIADKTPVERAWQELRKLGGTADESLITASPRRLKPLKEPGAA